MKRVFLTTLAGFLQLSALSEAPFPLFTTGQVPSGLIDNVIDLYLLFFFGQRFSTIHWQILYEIAI